MKCAWCDRNFDEKKHDGVCPNCGAYNEVKEKPKSAPIPPPEVKYTPPTPTYTRRSTPKWLKSVGFVLLLLFYQGVSEVMEFFDEREKAEIAQQQVVEADFDDVPYRYSQYSVGEAIMEGSVVVDVPDNYAVIKIPDNAKEIAQYAFTDSAAIAVLIPDSVRIISEYAFYDAIYLEYAPLPESLTEVKDYAFFESGDEDVPIDFGTIPEGLRIVGDYAFASYAVTSLPQGIQVGINSFDYTDYFENTDEDGFTTIGDTLVKYIGSDKNVMIPEGIKVIDNYAFYDNRSIETVVMPNSVEVVGDYAFYSAKSLTGVGFSEELEIIGEEAFSECVALEAAHLPEGLIAVGDKAFSGCEALAYLNIPSTIEDITGNSFSFNKWYYDNYPFYGVYILGDGILTGIYIDHSLKILHIPEGVKRIASKCVHVTRELEEIIIPEGVTTIDEGAFSLLGSGDEILFELPNSLTYIENTLTSSMLQGKEISVRCDIGSYAYNFALENGYTVIPR